MSRKVVALVTDAYGGRGGIALYNRNLLAAICSHPDVSEVVALPRCISYEFEALPRKLRFDASSAGSKWQYARSVLGLAGSLDSSSLVICSHLHLLPFASVLGLRFGCRVLPVVYGREAWRPTAHGVSNVLSRRIDSFVSIRKMTADRFKRWAGIPDAQVHYLPNCVDLARYGIAPRRADLVNKYGLAGRTVIMTAGRIDVTEKNKGFDEMLETLPYLRQDIPNVVYLIMGDGNDRPRLQGLATALGVADQVVFTGYVPEAEKADHYRLADVAAMPGSDALYDRYPYRFAFLEPLACGVPVVGSEFDDSSERDDPDAKQLVVQVNPHDPVDIRRGILAALAKRGRGIEPALAKLSYEAFEQRTHAILEEVLARR